MYIESNVTRRPIEHKTALLDNLEKLRTLELTRNRKAQNFTFIYNRFYSGTVDFDPSGAGQNNLVIAGNFGYP
jgi:hypothetical protein